MDSSSKLIPNNIIAQCDSAIKILTENNDNMLDALTNIEKFISDTSIESAAFDAVKNQIQNFYAVINLLRTANLADIDDYNTLKGMVGSEELDGAKLLELLEEANRQKKANEAYIAECSSASSSSSNSTMKSYTAQLIKDYEQVLELDNKAIADIQAKIDFYDEVDAKSGSLFDMGTSLRQAAKSALSEITNSSISGGQYICPSNASICNTILSKLNTTASTYMASKSFNGLYNVDHDVSIYSQNLRNGKLDKDDDDNTYWKRIGRMLNLIDTYESDIMCFQECTNVWNVPLTIKLNPFKYECVSESNSKGLSNPIYINKEKFDVVDSGNITVSEEYISKKNGKLQESRIASWAIVEDKETGKTLLVVNTHLALDNDVQLESCQMIKDFAENQDVDGYIMTGDYNFDMDSNKDAYAVMTGDGKDMAIAAGSEGVQGDTGITFHGYGKEEDPDRIDFFFGSDTITSDMYTVVDDTFDGKYASDHYGVLNYFSFNE